ncbi:MAG TPA: zinc ribbon domain-containing protein [Candidatus Limnocylindrales bacterium]|nr:zinc ribbon domain-containing protein [Candidatus Limnocylindrales bacterium]
MTELFDLLGETFGSVLAHPAVTTAARLAVVYLVVLWLASAWWVWRDARARYRDAIAPYVAAAAIVLVTPLLFPLAAVVYRVLRPSRTVAAADAEEIQLTMLEEEASRPACGRCGSLVEEDWVACPACGGTLAVRCETCGRPLELDWTICAWCAADVPWALPGDGPPGSTLPTLPEPVAIPIRPGGRPLVPVMAVPDEADEPASTGPARRRLQSRRRAD